MFGENQGDANRRAKKKIRNQTDRSTLHLTKSKKQFS